MDNISYGGGHRICEKCGEITFGSVEHICRLVEFKQKLFRNRKKKVFIICPVRLADENIKSKLNKYTEKLELEGYKVHLPHRDTNQIQSDFDICKQNMKAIKTADEVHIFYLPDSQGIHFDLGVSFALNKKIKLIEHLEIDIDYSFKNMINRWGNTLCT
jgi:hypothetical protein